MINYVWAAFMMVSVVFGGINGTMGQVSNAVLDGGKQAVNLCLSLMGMMVLWSGLSAVMQQSGLSSKVAGCLSPLISLLFPELKEHTKAREAISLNVAANLLGMGNAATPLGLKAMARLQELNPHPKRATNSMITFVVLNSVSVQILPTSVAALRASYGATQPMDIVTAVWFTSVLGAATGMVLVAVLNQRRERFDRIG